MNKPTWHGHLLLLTSILLLTAFTFTGSGCHLLKRDKQSIGAKKEEAANKKANAEYDNALKQHYKHQSKEAKKMMKHTKKQSAEFNKPMKRKRFSKIKCN